MVGIYPCCGYKLKFLGQKNKCTLLLLDDKRELEKIQCTLCNYQSLSEKTPIKNDSEDLVVETPQDNLVDPQDNLVEVSNNVVEV